MCSQQPHNAVQLSYVTSCMLIAKRTKRMPLDTLQLHCQIMPCTCTSTWFSTTIVVLRKLSSPENLQGRITTNSIFPTYFSIGCAVNLKIQCHILLLGLKVKRPEFKTRNKHMVEQLTISPLSKVLYAFKTVKGLLCTRQTICHHLAKQFLSFIFRWKFLFY